MRTPILRPLAAALVALATDSLAGHGLLKPLTNLAE